MRGTHGNVNP